MRRQHEQASGKEMLIGGNAQSSRETYISILQPSYLSLLEILMKKICWIHEQAPQTARELVVLGSEFHGTGAHGYAGRKILE
jgi:hypothetical protein